MAAQGGYQSNDRVGQLRGQVDEVKCVMSQNIERIIERDGKLDQLVNKTGDLEANAVQFKHTTKKVKKKMWWKNTKMTLILIVAVVIAILIVVFSLVPMGGGGGDQPTVAPSVKPTVSSPSP